MARLNQSKEMDIPGRKGLSGEGSSALPRSSKFPPPADLLGVPSTQSQTVSGSRSQEFEDRDSDEEDFLTRRYRDPGENLTATAAGSKKEDKRPASRRYTINAGEGEDEDEVDFELREEDKEHIFLRVSNIDEFTQSAKEHPHEWCNAVRNLITSMTAYQESNQNLSKETLQIRQQVASLKQQLIELKGQLTSELDQSNRLRERRDLYRNQATSSKEEVQSLKDEVLSLKEQVKNAAPIEKITGSYDSDDEGTQNNAEAVTTRGGRRGGTPATNLTNRGGTPALTTMTNPGVSNNRYPDVPDFHGTHDKGDWESWQMHLDSKFLASWELFPTEYSKINYIRDKCKDVAFDVIKIRAKLSTPGHYTLAMEAIADLDNMFGEYDKEGRADAELHNPKFAMGAKDNKETFDAFLARFTATVAPLDLSEFQKISNVRRLVSNRLRNKVTDGTTPSSFPKFISRLRQLDVDMRVNDEISPRGNRGGNESGNTIATGTKGGRGTSSTNRGGQASTSGSRPPANKFGHAAHVIERLRKENRCFKCLKPGHQSFYADAPCKDTPAPSKEQRTALLATAGIDTTLPESPAVELQAEN